MRSAVSAVVWTTSADRAAEGSDVAPRAARMRSFSAGSRTVIRNRVREAADDEPLRLELVGTIGEPRTRTKFAGGRRAVEAGGEERLAHPLALGDRHLDVEPRLAQRGGGDPRGGRRDRRGVAASVELAGELGRRDRVADAQRRQAERLRQRADRDQVRRLRDQRDDRLAAVLDVRLVDDDGGVRAPRRRGRRSPRARRARPSGCSGCRSRRGRASAGSSVSSAPSIAGRDRVQRSTSGASRRRAGRARGRCARRGRSARPRPRPTTICSGSTPA